MEFNTKLYGGGACAVQRLVANGRNGRRLVGHGLGNLEVVERWCADGPCVAENGLGFAVKVRELGRIGLCGHDGERSLSRCQCMPSTCSPATRTFHALVAFPHRPKQVVLPPVVKISQSWVVGGLAVGSTVRTSFQFSRVIGYWIAAAVLDAALLVAVSTGADGMEGMDAETAAVALLKKPFTLSRRGTCSSATASAGRARRMPDEKRIVVVCGKGVVLNCESCGRYACALLPDDATGSNWGDVEVMWGMQLNVRGNH